MSYSEIVRTEDVSVLREYLERWGATLLPIASQWEICRYRVTDGVVIFHRRKTEAAGVTVVSPEEWAWEWIMARDMNQAPWFSPVNLAASFERRKPKPEPVVEIDWAIGPGDDGWDPDPPREEVHAVVRLKLTMDMTASRGVQLRAVKFFLEGLVGTGLDGGELTDAELVGLMSEADLYSEGG